MFWADEIADEIIAREPHKPVYRVHDYKTPSGRIHVGALRGVVVHDLVAQALRQKNLKVDYVYGFDDFDPMDGFPVYLPESFRQYMGQPLCEVPSPDPKYANFARCYAEEFMQTFHTMHIKPTILWASDLYKAGEYNDAIRIALDKAELVRQIDIEVSGANRAEGWHPFSVLCPQCKKIGTTRVSAWNGEEVTFTCEPHVVTWAEGCGHSGQVSPFNGSGKLFWKAEWAAKWMLFDEDFETAGKDHMTKNGSFDVATRIAREVYGVKEPIGRRYPYEWLLIGGKKMSSSKGTGATAHEVAEALPAQLLHFLIAKTKPSRHVDFVLDTTTLPLLYDEYDRALTTYYSDPGADAAQVIRYTHAADHVVPRYVMRFSKVAFLTQMPHVDLLTQATKEKGSPLTQEENEELTSRIAYAQLWLDNYADDSARFTLQLTMPSVSLSEDQRHYVTALAKGLTDVTWSGEAIHSVIHDLKNASGLAASEAFGALYQLFLGKLHGPQAGWFLASLEKDFVIQRLTEASKE